MYPVVFFDALRVKIRGDGVVSNKAVYLALGIQADGQRDVLGLWIEQTEGTKFWLKVFNELKTRGCQDILMESVLLRHAVNSANRLAHKNTDRFGKAERGAPHTRGIDRSGEHVVRGGRYDGLVTEAECASAPIPDAPLPPPSQGTRFQASGVSPLSLLPFFAAAKKGSAAPHRGNANRPPRSQGKAKAARTAATPTDHRDHKERPKP